MNHSFTASQFNNAQCAKCKRAEIDHTSRATCEACSNSGNCELYVDILLCQDCLEKENALKQESMKPENVQARLVQSRPVLSMNTVIDRAKSIDSTIQVRTDLFNAETVSIEDIRSAINSDSSVENKDYKLAETVLERMKHFQKVVFELSEEVINKQTQIRADQTYLNNLVNKLRVEEREKLKLQDITYKPESPKISKPRLVKTSKKPNPAQVREYALKYGVPELAVQMICVSRNVSPEEAAVSLSKAMGPK